MDVIKVQTKESANASLWNVKLNFIHCIGTFDTASGG